MASELAAWSDVDGDEPAVAPARMGWLGRAERLVPVGARLLGRRYFRDGVDRAACRALHGAAARGSLYGFAPPPTFTLMTRGRGRRAVDVYRGRAPLVSGLVAAGETRLQHHRGRGTRGTLVVVTPGVGAFADLVARRLAARLVAVGFDVAVPMPFGPSGEGGDGDWSRTIGAALAAIVRRVHDGVAVESWGRQLGYRSIGAAGVGIGGTVTALLAATTSRFDATVAIVAGAHPGRMWLPPRALARATDHGALARDDVRHARTLLKLFDPVAPGRMPSPRRRDGAAVVGLRRDTFVPPADVQALADHWRVRPIWLPRGHLELPACADTLAAVIAHAATTAERAGAA